MTKKQEILSLDTPQKIFSFVINHLQTQGRSFDEKTMECMYRGSNNTSCAVGCLILDGEYTKDMEGINVDFFPDRFPHMKRLFPHIKLLTDLQRLHDLDSLWEDTEYSKYRKNERIKSIADKYGLENP